MIEIPGYRLLRQLGRGGMATVYLAIQESVDREVALKVMSPALLADPSFGERFLREAKIAARLHHRHVVGIHDVGRAGDYHYIAMEYLAGGPVLGKDGRPRSVPFALRVIREIATAINYAQQKGFIHRDIKPDNILLRDDGSAALTDFGIARANDSSTRMTRTGAVVGTPHYMSPEQARGRPIDGRSDLYSLGVVLYEMLVGRVPYHAEDSLAVGIMHITQPVPVLAGTLAVLQPLIDRLLAKEPAERFQTGAEAAAAIARFEQAITSGELPELAGEPPGFRRDANGGAVTPTRISSRPSPVEMRARHRAEPSLGRLDEIAAATDQHIQRASRARVAARPARRSLMSLWVTLACVLVGVAGFSVWKYQDRLRAMLPSTELNDILARAQQALAADRLDGSAGESARELFQRARSLDPDNDIARRGLGEVADRLLARARTALEANDSEGARAALASARELLGGGSAVEELARSIVAAESRGSEVEGLVSSARDALDAGRVLGDDGAVALYQRALSADPGNAVARAGLARSGERLDAQARTALDGGDLEEANRLAEEIARILPGHAGLPELRARLGRARDDAAKAIEQDLARAESRLRAGRVSGTADSAQAVFESVLAREPGNARAQAGLRRVAQALVVQASAAVEDSNPGAAERLLNEAARLSPDLAELRTARIELRELRERLAIAASRPTLTPADVERVGKLVAEALAAVEAGRLIEPPGNSAYDKYRAALAIDGDNRAALDGMARLPARARTLYDEALAAKSLPRARAMYEAYRQLAPSDTAATAMRERLVGAWLDEADARIADQRREDAVRALKAARELDPGNARLATIERKLEASAPAG
ncbi:serine/threonine-protein kinase [Dokdonella sp.]|uniref:serine/threonine-protein kinase n=1 Tax=Dokdonella sp. TaxID=2291710 RepID=UPI0025C37E43|nr:serine/threonine-protein kinase [Dokdonella sp.]MBX3690625.1 protein kinase [Dokdonella sp.]